MSGPFEVLLTAFPSDKKVNIERVVHKHNRAFTHQQYHALVADVASGTAKVVGTYAEEHSAQNLVLELAYHKAQAEVRGPSEPDE